MQVNGFGGSANPMKVAVKIDGDTVESVKVLEYAGETGGYGKRFNRIRNRRKIK